MFLISPQISSWQIVGTKIYAWKGAKYNPQMGHGSLRPEECGQVHIEQTVLAIAKPRMNEPLHFIAGMAIERAFKTFIGRRVVLPSLAGWMRRHVESFCNAVFARAQNFPEAFLAFAYVYIRQFANKFRNCFGFFDGSHCDHSLLIRANR